MVWRILAVFMVSFTLMVMVPGCGSSDPLILPNPSSTQLALGNATGVVLAGGVVQGGVALSTVPESATTSSLADGTYSLTGIPPGRYTLVATKDGFLRAFANLEVRENRTSQTTINLFAQNGSGSISGQITDGAFGLENVVVTTTPATQRIITTNDGRFVLSGPPGRYEVQARRLGYSSSTRVVQILEGQTATLNLALGPRSDGQLTGQVTDQTGLALVNARVDLFFNGQATTAFTDASGNYSFFNLTTGFYVLSAEADGFLPSSKGLEARGGTMANGDLVLYPTSQATPVPGSITGTIANAFDIPLENITVTLSVAATPASAVTLADGRYTFVNVPAGSATITATQVTAPPGGPVFSPGTRVVNVGGAQTADGSLNLEEI